jgi:hypothetical protein
MECWSGTSQQWVEPALAGTHLDTANTELNQGSQHLSTRNLVSSTADGALDEQRVVVRLESSALDLPSSLRRPPPTVICAPAYPELASNRTPFPPADLYTSIFPVSGWKPAAASSVVIRH